MVETDKLLNCLNTSQVYLNTNILNAKRETQLVDFN